MEEYKHKELTEKLLDVFIVCIILWVLDFWKKFMRTLWL